jgi:hypothetical protein
MSLNTQRNKSDLMESKAILPLLILFLILSNLVYSDSLYYYHGLSNFYTTKIIKFPPYFTNISDYFIISDSTANCANNLSVDITQLELLNLSAYTILVTQFNLYVPKGAKIIFVPIEYEISEINGKLAFCNISLVFSCNSGYYVVPLVSNAKIDNVSYYFTVNSNFYTVNVSWSFSIVCYLLTYFSKIVLMVIVQIGGANYIYFWNIQIVANLIGSFSPSTHLIKLSENLCPLKVGTNHLFFI